MINKIIHASAGTGKTHTLLNEIFHFDENGKPTENMQEINKKIDKSIFLTFSNAGAEEIKSRIINLYYKFYPNNNTDFFSLINNFVNPRVMTIHSFCMEVAKIFRYELGLPADIIFSSDDCEIWELCVNDYFKKYWAIDNLVKLNDNERIKKIKSFFYNLFDNKKDIIINFIKNYGSNIYFLNKLGVKSVQSNIELVNKSELEEILLN